MGAYVFGSRMKKKLVSDNDMVVWVVEEAFVKDEYRTAKKQAAGQPECTQ